MKRFPFGLLTAGLAVLVFSLLVTGCGKKNDDDDEAPRGKGAKVKVGGPAAVAQKKAVPNKESGVIKGKVAWVGDLPDLAKLTKDLQTLISKKADDAAYCMKGKEYETTEQIYRIGENKGLGHVFVWIEPLDVKEFYFEVPADQLAKFKTDVVTITQPHCAFLPHAAVLFPSYTDIKTGKEALTGQKLIVKNDATIGHNSQVGGNKNQVTNWILGPGNEKVYEPPLKPERGPVTVACGVHGWMKAYLRVFDHPYAAVTNVGADVKAKLYEDPKSPNFGAYEITGVPVGAKVRLIAWHEELGYLEGAKGREITIKKEDVQNFEAKSK